MVDQTHRERIINELKQAGVTKYGLMRSESKYLPHLISEDEHIGGVIYGRVGIDFTMLVATDRRVLYFQNAPFFSDTDEVTYDVVAGVKNSDVVLFSSVTLHTRVKDYTINYVNVRCARKFVKYIESRRIKKDGYNNSSLAKKEPALSTLQINTSVEGLKFLKEHETGVLSTVNKKGDVGGAVVYYVVLNDFIYIVTKSATTKARNIFGHSQIGLTVFEPFSAKTVQISGSAEVEKDTDIRKKIFDQIVKPRSYKNGEQYPPVTKIADGAYTVIRITPLDIKFSDFSSK